MINCISKFTMERKRKKFIKNYSEYVNSFTFKNKNAAITFLSNLNFVPYGNEEFRFLTYMKTYVYAKLIGDKPSIKIKIY